ncbi:Ycf66 family protein [Chroococcus sp. FPU101]|uniref:Ycf66 family protein n=1 Tax=Chroococcus sp. FPU101 TaxID=1974212 RepID=UPI001A8CE585|nr:Ycf66 family protein [Chroococcus sp. FPU101]GFE71560.1 Ycf66 family protein [Chroococcus sp. FPU101]
MVNFGLNSASILGIFLAVAGAGLYFMRTIRPELSRDHDIFFAAVGLLCGFILLFQGWRLDPILQFGQFLLTGAAVFFAFETIKLRGVATEQARRNSPVVDDERPVSRVYRAELDQLEPYETDEPYDNNPRLRGYDEPRNTRSSKYDSDEPRSTRTRPTSERPSKDTQKQRRTRPSSQTQNSSYNEWNDSSPTDWEEPPTRETRRRRPSSDVGDQQPTRQSSRKRPNRSSENRSLYQDEAPAPYVDYVDYQPVDEDKEENGEQATKPKSSPERDESNDDNSVRYDY